MLKLLVAPVVTAALLVGCGGGGGGSSDSGVAGEGAAGRGDAEPTADDMEAVTPYLEDLLAEHDRLVAEILSDPSVAEDDDDSLIVQYRALFTPDSSQPDEVIGVWADEAAAGVTVGPYDDEHPMVETFVDGDVEVVDDDEVRIPTCEVGRERVFVDSELSEGIPLREQAGETVAVRVDGHWRISSREVHADRSCAGGAA